MIREYAVDPEAIFRNLDSLQRFFNDFAAQHGRVISAIPTKWFDEHKCLLKKLEMSPKAKRSALDKLLKIKNTSLITGYSFGADLNSWLEKAMHVKELAEINGIISNRFCSENQIFDYRNLLENGPTDWDLDHSISVERTAEKLASTIEFSLKVASAVFYVDPYFDPNDPRYLNPLSAFIKNISEGRLGTKLITIHTSNRNTSIADLKRGMKQILQPDLPSGFTVKLFIWQPQQLHDRFILTKQTGYSFGHGLDENEYQNSLAVNVTRLSENARAQQFAYFSTKDDLNDRPIIAIGR